MSTTPFDPNRVPLSEWAPGRPASKVGSTFWAIYDIALAGMAILVSTEVLNRFHGAIPPVVWLLTYGMTLVRIASAWRSFFDLLIRNLNYLAYPAVCASSVLWSVTPSTTLTASVQLLMTVIIAMVIGWRFSLLGIAIIQFIVIGFATALSLLNWATGIFGEVYSRTGALLGVYSQKNALGQRTLFMVLAGVTLLLTSAREFMPGLRRHARYVWLAALVGIPPALLAIGLSISVTSILMLPVVFGLMFLFCVRRLPQAFTFFGFAGILLAVSIAPLAFALAGLSVVDETLGAFGKTTSLTGRTDLWGIGFAVLEGRLGLGVGFQAFWKAPAFANYALLAQHYGSITALGFHNFILEVWVGTGLLGLAAMALLLLTSITRAIRLLFATWSASAAYAVVGSLLVIPLSLIGTSLYRQHEFLIMFVVMIGVSAGRELNALGAARRPAQGSRQRSARRT